MKKVLRGLYWILGIFTSLFFMSASNKPSLKMYISRLARETDTSEGLIYAIIAILFLVLWPIWLVLTLITFIIGLLKIE